jgi:2'-5' RNA ligase
MATQRAAMAVQQVLHAALQAREQRRLKSGGVPFVADPQHRHVTSVVRLPTALAHGIADATARLPGMAGHYRYPAADIHVTVLNLDPTYRGRHDHVAAARRVLERAGPFELDLRGFGISAHSVYVKVYDRSGELRRLRSRLARATGCPAPIARRWLAVANVARFAGTDVAELAAAITDTRAATVCGRLEATSIEIVETDKLLSSAATDLLYRVGLSRPAPP